MPDKMIKYRAGAFDDIYPVEVIRETGASILIKGQKRLVRKRSGYKNYFDTWEAANQHLIKIERGKIGRAERSIKINTDWKVKAEQKLDVLLKRKNPNADS